MCFQFRVFWWFQPVIILSFKWLIYFCQALLCGQLFLWIEFLESRFCTEIGPGLLNADPRTVFQALVLFPLVSYSVQQIV